MRRVTLSATLALVLLWVGTAGALAQPLPSRAGAGPDRLRQALGLSAEQAERVNAAMAAFRQRIARLRIDLARARLDLQEQMLQRAPDRARVDAAVRRISEVQSQMLQARVELQMALKQILTPEQEERYRALMRQRFRFQPRMLPRQQS